MEEPLITVIVPVYRVEKYLPVCLESLFAQTYRNLEIVLVDDGSPDACGRICDEYARRDSRATVIHQENAGVSAARNAGLAKARGTYIGFVDADDWAESDMFESLCHVAVGKHADLVICDFYAEGRGVYSGKTQTLDRETALELLFAPDRYGGFVWNKFFAAKLLRGPGRDIRFDTNVSYCEDAEFTFECLLRSQKTVYMPEAEYHYRSTRESITAGLVTANHLSFIIAHQAMRHRLPPEFHRTEEAMRGSLAFISVNMLFLPHDGPCDEIWRQLQIQIRQNIFAFLRNKRYSFKIKAWALLAACSLGLFRTAHFCSQSIHDRVVSLKKASDCI